MPSSLTATKIKDTYGQLLHVDGGVTSTPKLVYDGDGTATALKVSTTDVQVNNSPVLTDADIGSSVQAYDADLTAWSGKTAPNGTVVGTTDTQTLSSKTFSDNPTFSAGTANGVAYLNGSKVLTTGSALTFDGTVFVSPNLRFGSSSNYLYQSATTTAGLRVGTSPSYFAFKDVSGLPLFDGPGGALGFGVGGSEQMRLTSTGLGIGTSSPAAKLHVSGGNVRLSDGQQIEWGGSTNSIEGSNASNYLRFWTNNTDRMLIDSSGNLGLGVTPSGWSVFKAIDIGATGSVACLSTQQQIGMNYYWNGSNYIYKTTNAASYYNQNSGQHVWFTAPSGTAGNAISFTQAMTLDASGNLGIGTSSPQTKLDVNGGIRIGYGSPLICYAGSNVTENTVLNNYYDYNGNDTLLLKPSGVSGGGQIIFAGRAGTERMRIDSDGNVLVGRTSLFGSEKVSIESSSSNTCITTYNFTATSVTHHEIRNQNGIVGSIVASGGNTSYNTSSDYRLKENIQPMQNALARNALLKPCTYSWKADGSTGEGFIAHELQAVCPDAVTGEKDAVDKDGNPVYQGVDTSFLVGHLVACINELKAELDATKAEVAALKAVN